MMAAEFKDYWRGPGYWFYLELLIASDISENPLLSADVADFDLQGRDLFDIFDRGIAAYELMRSHKRSVWE